MEHVKIIRMRFTIPTLPRSVRVVLLFFFLTCLCPAADSWGEVSAARDDYEREIRELAQAGDGGAQFALAQILDLSRGPAQNREEAIIWLRKAADQNFAAACFTLGLKYEFGATIRKDLQLAAAWYRRAALQDLPMAQYRLGLLHLPEDGAAPEPIPAFAWLSLAAEHGYPDAAENRDRAAGFLAPEDRLRAKEMREELRQQIRQQQSK
ncbi:MAG: tetratricopeptide repeat protein [Desulfobulbaceae bacterium]